MTPHSEERGSRVYTQLSPFFSSGDRSLDSSVHVRGCAQLCRSADVYRREGVLKWLRWLACMVFYLMVHTASLLAANFLLEEKKNTGASTARTLTNMQIKTEVRTAYLFYICASVPKVNCFLPQCMLSGRDGLSMSVPLMQRGHRHSPLSSMGGQM